MIGGPHVTVHFAQTLDGRIATRTGDSQWISGVETRRLAHELRASHAAVLVGIGTVLADDPRLTVRLVDGPSPLRVVVDSQLRIPLEARVLNDSAASTIVFTTARSPSERVDLIRRLGAEVIVEESESGRLNLRLVLARLRELGVPSVLVEGGSRVITSVLRDRLADRVVICLAPMICGKGVDAVGDLGTDRLANVLTFKTFTFQPVGPDLVFDGCVR